MDGEGCVCFSIVHKPTSDLHSLTPADIKTVRTEKKFESVGGAAGANNGTPAASEWVHLAASVDNTATPDVCVVTLFVDGVQAVQSKIPLLALSAAIEAKLLHSTIYVGLNLGPCWALTELRYIC